MIRTGTLAGCQFLSSERRLPKVEIEQIGYTLPKDVVKSFGAKRVRFLCNRRESGNLYKIYRL